MSVPPRPAPSPLRRGALAGLLALTLWACGQDNTLGGSLDELFSLEVSRVDVLRNEHAFQVSYYANREQDVDLVARVTVALEGVSLEPGGRIDLHGEYTPGHQRTTVVHMPGGEPLRLLPPVREGDLKLDEGGEPGEQTRGNFSMSFEENGGFGSGRNLHGSFNAVARDAGFGDVLDAGVP